MFFLKIAEWLDERSAKPRRDAAMSEVIGRVLKEEDARKGCEKPREEKKDNW